MKKYHMLVYRILDLLSGNNVWYESFEHTEVKTSLEASKTRPGYNINQGAKALILKYRKSDIITFVMFVMQGADRINNKLAKKLVGVGNLTFATPEEVFNLTDGVKIGGIPPFGNLFGIKVYADRKLLLNDKIVFNAGDRGYSIAIHTKDYLKIVNPIIADFVNV